ncbi:DUF624 domain-containing protein [Zhihengliuella halotolerans]|uniref:DUF624 domain-containing protein n=1 Tax=Zhihengliuella halotolerans TaxID=370736 RepID=UPI000C7FCCAC|nr:DUF624 domain-containing protein [Zhihengliuella halotolerans]
MSETEPLGWAGRVMVVLGLLARLLAVQALWVLGACAGLLVLGAAPATIAALRCLDPEDDAGLWRSFWRHYRRVLVSAQPVLLPFGAGVACALFNLLVVVPEVPGAAGAVLLVVSTVAVAAAAAGGIFAAVYAASVPGARPGESARFGLLGPWLAPGRAAACVGAGLAALAMTTTAAAPIAILFGIAVPLLVARAMVGVVVDRIPGVGTLAARPT